MKTMKKILAFALAGVMALALLTGCGTGSSASHKSIAKAMADYDNGNERKTTITYTSSAELDALLQTWAANPKFETIVEKVYNGDTLSSSDIPDGVVVPNDKVVYLYCGKYDKDAGKQALNLNAWDHYTHISSNSSLADERKIGLITTSFTDDTTNEKVKVRFAVVVSEIPTATP
jgi:ABC-type glycerol-3-phosphate transport system substrate-binding protein